MTAPVFELVDPQAVRQALAARLETKVAGWGVKVHANDIESPTGKYVAIVAGIPYLEYFITSGTRGISKMNVTLEIGVGGANAINKQIHIDDMLGIGTDHSLFDAIMEDVSLGDVVQTVGIENPTGPTSTDPLGRLPLTIVLKKGGNS